MSFREELIQANQLNEVFAQAGYVLDPDLAVILFLLLKLDKPLLIEGHAGVGKTEAANALAQALDTELIRLQCYEGLDVNTAVYEWNYQKQLLAIKTLEQKDESSVSEQQIFSRDYLLQRPLLRAISAEHKAPVLLIDEIDRADEEFEAFLLELLSAFQISIPELGTIQARHKPLVILTSNRSRELSDALKRRCLYHWIDYPSFDKERRILSKRIPHLSASIADRIVSFVQALRPLQLAKTPGVAETLDWAAALLALGSSDLHPEQVRSSLGCLLKTTQDLERITGDELERLLASAHAN